MARYFKHTPTTAHVRIVFTLHGASAVSKRNQQGIPEGNAAGHTSWVPATRPEQAGKH